MFYYFIVLVALAQAKTSPIKHKEFVTIGDWGRGNNGFIKNDGNARPSVFQIFKSPYYASYNDTIITSRFIRLKSLSDGYCFIANSYLKCFGNTTYFTIRLLDKHGASQQMLNDGDYVKFRLNISNVDCNVEFRSKRINCVNKSNDPLSYGFVIRRAFVS